ncbi:hypothetical protein RclHR1_00930027 [Rhizophagus clarus]|uniref:Uncharacterized protein n=1 Tax=Rhizophagus clarus TaxID=94130 RepID=A0A2Z6SQE3_9GLOM|nr:hypothetical protein RclHR1_00930027 [Rhizophagus clarus]
MLTSHSGITGFDNDPSAGSPTETLLRLLLPLNDKVQWTSFDVASSKPPTSPQSEHFTGPFNRQRTKGPQLLARCCYMLTSHSGITGFDNDPSAGSPTETLLRLLLPLNDKVQWTSFDVASSKPPTSPQSEHFTGPFNR